MPDLKFPRAGDPAFDLWLDRFNWLATQRDALKATREAGATPLAGFEAIVAQALSQPTTAVTVAGLDQLQARENNGERIEPRLLAMGLTPGAFAFMMPLLRLARSGSPIVDAEWNILYDTLLLARKTLEFPAWRTAEQAKKLTLSPRSFSLADMAEAPEPARSLDVPFWLSTRDARRAWTDVLQARITQEETVASALGGAVATVEETTLPVLRNALVDAADIGHLSRSERVKWLTKHLLCDYEMSGRIETTRTARAIETLQELLFGLRTGQLAQDVVPAHAPLEAISAVGGGVGRIDLIARGADDVLWRRGWDGQWRDWQSLGLLPGSGLLSRPSNPVVLAGSGARLDVVVRGGDDVLWHLVYEHGWSEWRRVHDDLPLVGNPTAVRLGPDAFDVFALRRGDLHVMQRRFDNGTWTPWESTGVVSSRSPAATSGASGRVDVFLAHPSPSLFKPHHRWRDGGAWQEETLDSVLAGDPAAASPQSGRLELFQNYLGHLRRKSWDGAAWKPWDDLDAALGPGAPVLIGTPSVYSAAPDTLDVFALRSDATGVNVWRRRFGGGVWTDWEKTPVTRMTLEAPDFETEWPWIGSYEAYRSATFANVYCDNLLLPSLLSRQTPAFQRLVKNTRSPMGLSRSQTCEQALAYASYLRDVSLLDVEASCQVLTTISKGPPCKTAAPLTRNLLYMFGRTKEGRVYWCATDPQDRSGFAQSFWDEVPLAPDGGKAAAVKAQRIIGALPWLDRSKGQHHIYLFLLAEHPSGKKLRRARFDLDAGAWEADVVDLADLPTYVDPSTNLEKPNQPEFLTILPVQSNSVTEAPRLAVHAHLTTFNAYIRPLARTGDDWESGPKGWSSFQVTPVFWDSGSMSLQPQQVGAVEAALRIDGSDKLLYRWAGQGGSARYIWDQSSKTAHHVCDPPSVFRGVLPGSSDAFFLFYDEDGQTIYREIQKGNVLGPAFIPSPRFNRLAPHSGSFSPKFFVVQKTGDYQPTFAYYCQAVGGKLAGTRKFQVIPLLDGVTSIPCGGSVEALQARRISIQKVYERNKGVSASILQYLREGYRFVPQQLGLASEASGEYVTALDWFSTVYDYRAPQGQRYIDYGLTIDAGLPDSGVYQHAEDWLLDPLNPHSIALTRRLAYTRFAIASLMRCMNKFADAEFTADSPESLPRARLLYASVLELGDVPEMNQQSAVCTNVMGTFVIQPGVTLPPAVAAALGEIIEEFTQGPLNGAPGAWIVLEDIKTLIQSGQDWSLVIPEALAVQQKALKGLPPPATAGTLLAEHSGLMARRYSGLLADAGVERMVRRVADVAVAEASDWLDQIKEAS
ncbi:hypothetical protein ACFQY9_27570 [Microvirga aerilata]|uniref:hypothetical protein n=1 Tax=Microvirga aerilata TaxID=670292 RepID=UPI0036408A72